MENIGKAYGFFDCKASKEEIEAELPIIRDAIKIPSELELSLMEGIDELKGDPDLMEIAERAQKAGVKYIIEASHPGETNKETSKELVDILDHIYTSPLYEKGAEFKGATVCKIDGEYVFAE